MARVRQVTDEDYARLLHIRTTLRAFEHWSAERAHEQGLSANQHQLLLAVRGHGDPAGPTVGEAADYLMIRHNTAVELADRCQQLGVLERVRDPGDHRMVRLVLTRAGRRRLDALAGAHIDELTALTPMIEELANELNRGRR